MPKHPIMAESGRRPCVAVLDSCWDDTSERAFVSRTVAGAIACHGTVDVLVPGEPGSRHPDGAFDVFTVGMADPPGAIWPAPVLSRLPDVRYDLAVVVGTDDRHGIQLATHLVGDRVLALSVDPAPHRGSVEIRHDDRVRAVISVAPAHPNRTGAGGAVHDIGFFVTTDAGAATAPVNGIGCTGYVLVLAASSAATYPSVAAGETTDLVAAAQWLVARFPRTFVLTLADGVVTVWRHRSPLGSVRVGTRMDLWRLLAFARVIVDPRPGGIVARECVESLLLGTPIVVPAGGAAGEHAELGGATYRDVAELLGAV